MNGDAINNKKHPNTTNIIIPPNSCPTIRNKLIIGLINNIYNQSPIPFATCEIIINTPYLSLLTYLIFALDSF